MNRVNRRAFIKQLGLAAGVGVPFLTSKVAMGQTSTAPLRVLFVPIQHGWGVDKNVQSFTGTSTNFVVPDVLRFLNPIKNQCVFVDGVRTSYWGNAHDVSYSDILTCGVPFDAPGDRAYLGGPFPRPRNASIDWVIGNTLNKDVLRFSHNYRSWGSQFHPMSWNSALERLTYHTSARSAWSAIINPLQGNTGTPSTTSQADKQALFDYLGADAQRLLNRPNVPKVKVEKYLTALNAIGNRIVGNTPTTPIASIPLPGQPAVSQSFNDQLDAYFDMIKVAFAYDTHRVGVLGLGEGASFTWRNPQNGSTQNGNTIGTDFHQDIPHYNKMAGAPHPLNRAAYEGWIQWYGNKIVSFANSLNSVQDVDGRTLLDNTLIVLLGEVGNGEHHRGDTTYILIGGGSRVTRGRWLLTEKVEPRNRRGVFLGSLDVNGNTVTNGINYGGPLSRHHAADLWVSVARLAGVNLNSFGFSVYNHQPIQLKV